MPSDPADSKPVASPIPRAPIRRFLPIAVGLAGLAMSHGSMLAQGSGRVQGDARDARLVHYILEHTYLWTTRAPLHEEFWNPPIFYPERNALAYSDTLVGSAAPYWAFRATGAAPDSSYQLWLVSTSALNFVAGCVLLRGGLGFGLVASTFGAALLSFGAPRMNELGHSQLLPHYWTFATVYALARLFRGEPGSRIRRALLWDVAALGAVGQFATGFYLGWFLVLGTGFAPLVSLAFPAWRRSVLPRLSRDIPAILGATLLGLLLLTPLAMHYARAARATVLRQYDAALRSVPEPRSWLHLGPFSRAWGWTARLSIFEGQAMDDELRMGIGLLTTLICLAGFPLRPSSRAFGLIALGILACSTSWPGRTIVELASWSVVGCASGIALERGHPWARLGVLAALLGYLTLSHDLGDRAFGIRLCTMILCATAAVRERGRPVIALALAGISSWLASESFPMGVVLPAAFTSAALMAVAKLLRWRRRPPIWRVALAAFLASACVLSFLDRPRILALGLLGPSIFLFAWKDGRNRPPARSLAIGTVVSLLTILAFRNTDTLWWYIYAWFPAGTAIRAVGRIGILMLIPAAVGLASALDRLEGRRRGKLAIALGLACVAEQSLAFPTFDKFTKRADVAAIASRVDRDCEAFYVFPLNQEHDSYERQVDGMWAGISTGKPSVNGYPASYPRDWRLLSGPSHAFGEPIDPEVDLHRVEDALKTWAADRGVSPGRIGWVGGREERVP